MSVADAKMPIASLATTLLPTRLVAVDGHAIRYHSQGNGQDVVLLHGLPETLQTWHAHARILAQNWRVHVFDWMGLGGSDAPYDYDYTYRGCAHLIEAVLDRLDVQQAHLVGTDIGLTAALLFAIKNPQRVRSLCVFDGAVFDRPDFYSWPIHALRTAPLGDIMTYAFPRTMFWIAMQCGYFGPHRVPADVWEDFHAQARRQRCREVALSILRSYRPALSTIEREVPELHAPMLILWGENDVFNAPEMGACLQKALSHRARLEIAPQCGHFLAQEKPEFFIDRLTDFLVLHGGES